MLCHKQTDKGGDVKITIKRNVLKMRTGREKGPVEEMKIQKQKCTREQLRCAGLRGRITFHEEKHIVEKQVKHWRLTAATRWGESYTGDSVSAIKAVLWVRSCSRTHHA